MSDTYDEFQGTELDPSLDFDFDDEEDGDLLRIIGASAAFAVVVGAVLVLLGRRKDKSTVEKAQEIVEMATKDNKKRLKVATVAATKAAGDLKLGDLLGDALDKVKESAGDTDLEGLLQEALRMVGDARDKAGKVVEDADLAGNAKKGAASIGLAKLLQDALDKAGDASKRVDLSDVGDKAKDARKWAGKRAKNAGLDNIVEGAGKTAGVAALLKLLEDALDTAKDASGKVDVSDLGDKAKEAGKRASKAVDKADLGNFDADRAGHILDDLREKLVEAIEQVREEVAPRAADAIRGAVPSGAQDAMQNVAKRMQEDVVPGAQGAVDRLREDVLPQAQERAGKLADQYNLGSKARKAASSAGSLGGILQGVAMAIIEKMVEDILPEARKAGGRAATLAKEEVIPAAASTAGDVAQRVREDVLPMMGEVASQTPGLLADVLAMAREKVSEALEKASPVVSDIAEGGAHGAAALASGAVQGGQGVTAAVSSGVSSAGRGVSSAGRGVANTAGAVVDATTYATRETGRILWWLSMLGAAILLVFVPDRDKQEEMWNNLRQFLGEVREMWRDLQGPDDLDTEDEMPA